MHKYKRTPGVAYSDQKKSAIKRGIGWDFNLETWIAWWKNNLGDDWFIKRGHHTGQYVMARNGDCGPYAPWNVRCALVEENHNEFNASKPSRRGLKNRKRLPAEKVKAIYQAEGYYKQIALTFDVTEHAVHCIKCRKCYRHVTEGIEKGPQPLS